MNKTNPETINAIKTFLINIYSNKIKNKQKQEVESIVTNILSKKYPEKTSFKIYYKIKLDGNDFLNDFIEIDFPNSTFSYSIHKTNITVARLSPLVKFYKNGISANTVYINFEENRVSVRNFLNINDIETAKEIIEKRTITDEQFDNYITRDLKLKTNDYRDKYNLERWNALPKLTKDWVIKEIADVEINPKVIYKMRFLLQNNNIPMRLNKKFIDSLIEIYEKKLEKITPIDMEFIDFDGELLKYITKNKKVIKDKVIFNLSRNNNIYANQVQTWVRKYLNAQENSVRNLQETQDTNPLSAAVQGHKVYFISGRNASADEKVDINIDNFMGVIDNLHVSEKKALKDNKFTNAISFKGDQMMIKVYTPLFQEKDITIQEYLNSPILTYDNIDYHTKTVKTNSSGLYDVYYFGNYTKMPLKDIPYYRHMSSMVSPSTARIPMLDKGYVGRGMYGAIQQGQAVTTVSSDLPLIDTGADNDVFNNFQGHIKSPIDGKIVSYKDDVVTIEDKKGQIETVELKEEYLETSNHNYNKYLPRFKVGQLVSKNDILFSLNSFTPSGGLKLTTPAYIMIGTYHSKENNDSSVISESFAKKLGCEEQYVCEIMLNPNKYEININTLGRDIYEKLGLPKIGDEIHRGEKIFSIGEVFDSSTDEGYIYSKLRRDHKTLVKTKTYYTPHEILNGTISKIEIIPLKPYSQKYGIFLKELETKCYEQKKSILGKKFTIDKEDYIDTDAEAVIKIYIDFIRPTTIGAKLSLLNGNKNTVSNILKDSQMPRTKDGKIIDMIISPLSTVPRMLGSQVYMLYLGKLAFHLYDRLSKNDIDDDLKEGLKLLFPEEKNLSPSYLLSKYGHNNYLRFKFYPYDSSINEEKLLNIMKLCKTPTSEKVWDSLDGVYIRHKVDVGYMDVMLLHIMAAKKFKVTPSVLYTDYTRGYGQIRGIKDGRNAFGNDYGAHLGEAMNAMQGHGSVDEFKQLLRNREVDKKPEITSAFDQILLRLRTFDNKPEFIITEKLIKKFIN